MSGVALALLVAPGCGSCKGQHGAPDASVVAPSIVTTKDFPPLPAAWHFERQKGIPSHALPSGCTPREPPLVARVSKTTRFVADPRALSALVVADASGSPPRLTGAGAVTLDPDAGTRDAKPVPWLGVGGMPRIARAHDGAWIAGFEAGGDDDATRVAVFRGAGDVEPLGEGDQFEPVDMACDDTRCALLTSRMGKVWAPGADLWIGKPSEPAKQWTRVTIAPARPDSDAHPAGLARTAHAAPAGDAGADAGAARGFVATLLEGKEVVFFAADDGVAPHEIARLPAPYGDLLDAIAAPLPMALVYASPLDQDGCSNQGGKIHLERAGLPPIEFRAAQPPLTGALRRLDHGYLATWIAPLGCNQPRHVVYAAVLDEQGAPTADPIPIGDADSFAVAATGSDVDLWVQGDGKVTWLRATCSAVAAKK